MFHTFHAPFRVQQCALHSLRQQVLSCRNFELSIPFCFTLSVWFCVFPFACFVAWSRKWFPCGHRVKRVLSPFLPCTMATDEDEFLLYTQDTVFVFKVPPRTSAAGYKCVKPPVTRGKSVMNWVSQFVQGGGMGRASLDGRFDSVFQRT